MCINRRHLGLVERLKLMAEQNKWAAQGLGCSPLAEEAVGREGMPVSPAG